MGLTEYETELQSVEMYCDEYRSSLDEGNDPGEFGLENYNNWLDSQGEGKFDGTAEEFLVLVHDVGFSAEDFDWV